MGEIIPFRIERQDDGELRIAEWAHTKAEPWNDRAGRW